MSVTVAARLLLENPGAGGAGGKDVSVTAVPFLLCFSLLWNLKMTALLSLLCECGKAKIERHTFLINTSQGLFFITEKSGRKKNVNWDHCLVFFVLQEAWLCEEAAIWQNVLKCEHRTGILSLSAARAEQLFTLKFWCGILLKFLQQVYSSFCLSCATAITVLGTRWLLKFWIRSLSMLGVTPAEKLCLFKTTIKKKKSLEERFFPFFVPCLPESFAVEKM